MTTRIGLGFDVHPFGGDRPLMLAGVQLTGPGLVGHSDADAVAHAVADALLGAVGLGDLGTMFPSSDQRWRDASSMRLLEQVVARIDEHNAIVSNVDIVIAAESPPLAPYVPGMVANLGTVLHDAPVSMKAKRGEGLGAIGRAEGIAVWAVALLETPSRPH